MKLINQSNGQVIAKEIVVANTFIKRLIGLLFTKNLSSDCALYLKPCNRIHTFFMRYSIDVLHFDSEFKLVEVEENLCPWKIGKNHRGTTQIIELPSGKVRQTETKNGHRLELIED